MRLFFGGITILRICAIRVVLGISVIGIVRLRVAFLPSLKGCSCLFAESVMKIYGVVDRTREGVFRKVGSRLANIEISPVRP